MDIDRDAPVTASAEALIYAPLDVVWTVLTQIEEWSRWNPDIKKVSVRGPLAAGTEFRWKAGGAPIVSVLREVVPRQMLAWTGRSVGIRAVHVWTLSEHQTGVTVRTEESFSGLLVRVFAGPMRKMLAASLERGLVALKLECERQSRASFS